MNRTEFMNKLRMALSGSLPYTLVEENIKYYEDYMDMELSKGKSEEEILEQLGDPRLIAKTIIEANKAEDSSVSYKEYTGEEENRRNIRVKKTTMPAWLITILVLCGIVVVIAVVSSLFFALLPYILMIMAISFIIKLFRKK